MTDTNTDLQKACVNLLKRLLPHHFGQITPIITPSSKDFFEISSANSSVQITANTIVSFAVGLKHYLQYFCKAGFLWTKNIVTKSLPANLPLPSTTVRKESMHKYRYYLNYCTFGYSMVWWDWSRWEYELDLMALRGINLCLMTLGQEAVWLQAFLHFGFSEAEALQWISVPSHLPWQWMGNLDSFGSPVPKSWITSHIDLARKVIGRMRELGIEPVFQGYYGIVPKIFCTKFPKAKIHLQGKWIDTLERPPLLDPTDTSFENIAQAFYREQEKLFGKAKYFAADPFHEGGLTEGINIGKAVGAIQKEMLKYNPDAIWVIQAWMDNPRDELLENLDQMHALILDLHCDNYEMAWEMRKGYKGTPWVFNIIHNFGGNPGMFGNICLIANNLAKALNYMKDAKMEGIGAAMEGIEQNQMIYDFIFDMGWEEKIPDVKGWFETYIEARYGGKINENVKRAWRILLDTVYGKEPKVHGLKRGSIIGRKFKPFSRKPCYTVTDLVEAWELFLNSKGEVVAKSEVFTYDLLMATKQVLTSFARWLYKDIMGYAKSRNVADFLTASNLFKEIILDVDELLCTNSEFMLGKSIHEAEQWGSTKEEKELYRWAAKTLVTLWDNVPNSFLNDYANKEWAGLLKDYYYVRWDYYLKQVYKAIIKGIEPNENEIRNEIGCWEKVWADLDTKYPSEPIGDTLEVSMKLYKKYAPVLERYCGTANASKKEDFISKWEFTEDGKRGVIEFLSDGKLELQVNGTKNYQWKNVEWDCREGKAELKDEDGNPVDVFTTKDNGETLVSHCSLLGPAHKLHQT
eukprot:TRINITY_DN4031_c1_g1_i1.p1 TRINITY_DN4031_c1_g1~~TRINITY_DN4031_c1_g1_i1.p1  ORF type:complete len:803 (-),score=81.27 TRINITY_DN4031_c1_g1_i1:84-2492(-)